MCGLAAFFQRDKIFSQELIQQVDRDLYHRGPDSGGSYIKPGFALIHRRLSILDISHDANQPMFTANNSISIVFNGEIYNYKVLRDELKSRGVRFNTSSDTEVVLEGYQVWGEKLFDKLEGMFGFVIVDQRKGTGFAVRDQLGIKPLYMRVNSRDNLIGFSSEIRPLLRMGAVTVDPLALGELLEYGWAAGTKTNLNEIEMLLPGTVATISLSTGKVSISRYYNFLETLQFESIQNRSFNEVVEETNLLIQKSVQDHLMSDVGYSVQLSGGVDSSLIASIVSDIDNNTKSYGIDLGNYEYNEKIFRNKVVDKYQLDHDEIKMNGIMFADALPRAVRHMEGPVPHGGCVFLMLLCDSIKKNSKVVLTGEGADEFFGGYERYSLWNKSMWQERFSRWLPSVLLPNTQPFKTIRKLSGKEAAVKASVYGNTDVLFKIFPSLIPDYTYREAVSSKFNDFRSKMFAVDQTSYLQSLLVRQDKMSMAASVEARVPFVHLPLVEYVNKIPHQLRAPGGITKPILKKVTEKYLPKEFVNRRKIGLLLPYDKWCDDPNALGRYLDYLTDADSKLSRFTEGNKLEIAVDNFRS